MNRCSSPDLPKGSAVLHSFRSGTLRTHRLQMPYMHRYSRMRRDLQDRNLPIPDISQPLPHTLLRMLSHLHLPADTCLPAPDRLQESSTEPDRSMYHGTRNRTAGFLPPESPRTDRSVHSMTPESPSHAPQTYPYCREYPLHSPHKVRRMCRLSA